MKGALIRFIFLLFAVLAPFFFPYPFALLLSFSASIFVPWLAFIMGLLTDALFYIPHDGRIPTASILGAFASLLALIVRRFIKARIMS